MTIYGGPPNAEDLRHLLYFMAENGLGDGIDPVASQAIDTPRDVFELLAAVNLSVVMIYAGGDFEVPGIDQKLYYHIPKHTYTHRW